MKKLPYLLIAALLLGMFATAQRTIEKKFEPYYGQKGVKKKISEVKGAPTTRTSAAQVSKEEIEKKEEKLRFRLDKFKKFKENLETKKQKVTELKETEVNGPDVTTQTTTLENSGTTQEVWSNFLASTFNENPIGWPPDPNGDVGSSQVVVLTNGSLKVFEKRGVTDPPLTTPRGTSNTIAPEQLFITLDEFFSPVVPLGSYPVDPHVRYDRLTKRWFVIAIEVNFSFENNFVLLAVSDGDRITDETSFTYYRFPSVLFPVSPDLIFQPFLDFPTLGVDKSAVVIGGVDFFWDAFFNADSIYFVGYIVDKKRLIRGELLVYSAILGQIDYFSGLGGGMVVPQGVQNGDAKATKSFFAGITLNLDGIALASIDYNRNNEPIGLTQTEVAVEQWNFPRDITAPGSPMPIDPLDTRLLAASINTNKLTGKSSLWTAHAIGVNETGTFVPDEEFTDKARTASRWYEIGNIYKSPSITQQGTVYDSRLSGRRATMYFNPSIAATGQGHAALGGTTTAFNEYLNVFVAGRYMGDPRGTLTMPERATRTRAIYAPFDFFGGYVGRWGDFSQTVVDPEDDQTIWTFQEYANVDDSYGTRAVQLKAPPPATPLPLGTLSNEENNRITLKGVSQNHSGFFDPGDDEGGPGFKRLTVKSTGGILVSNIRFISPTEIRFRLHTRNQAPGTYLLIITNPDGQFVTAEYSIGAAKKPALAAVQVNKEAASKFVASSSVYPNPTENEFTLVLNAAREVATKIIVTDISGKQMFAKTQYFGKGTNTTPLSLSNWNKGTYMVVVYNSDNVVIAAHKIVKE